MSGTKADEHRISVAALRAETELMSPVSNYPIISCILASNFMNEQDMNIHNSPASIGRRDFLKFSTAAAAAVAMRTLGERQVSGQTQSAKRPNIFFIFSDEHRWCSLPFTEMPELVAPNLTRLAKEGTRFDNCTSTSPICVPYRGMLLTGRWPHESSCISNDYFGNSKVMGVEGPTIAQTFKKAGYLTGYVGKWHLDEESVYNAGFDYFKHWLYGDEHWNSKYRDVPTHEEYRVYKGYNAIGMTDQALEFLGQHAKDDQPFLLMLSLNPPHYRWDDAPEEYVKLYPQEKLPFRPNVTDPKFKAGLNLRNYQHYNAHITAVDHEIGRLMDSLKQLGLDDNTIVIYTADHGSSFGSNGESNKSNPYDEATRVPFLVRWPGHVPAGRIADNLGTIDLYTTLCGFAGITPPANCGGQDFSPVMLGKPGPDPSSQLMMVNNFQRNYFRTQLDPGGENNVYPYRGVRSKQYTFVVWAQGDWLLFDNQKDPSQMHNLVNDPAYAEVKAGLRKELAAWLAKAEDPFIPAEWLKLSLPERIAVENRHYSIMPYKKQWDKYKTDAVAPYLAGATDVQQKELHAAADRVFDESFFSTYRAYFQDVHTVIHYSKRPTEQLRDELATHEKKYADLFKSEADRILAAGR